MPDLKGVFIGYTVGPRCNAQIQHPKSSTYAAIYSENNSKNDDSGTF